MHKPYSRYLLLPLLAVLAAAGYWGWQHGHSAAPAAPPAATATQKSSDTVRFEANAPQLSYLQIRAVENYPEPLVAALNARITYDDNHTARVYTPVAGRVLNIAVETGKPVKKGDTLLQLDAPDYAAAAADLSKAQADLSRKLQAYERAKQLYAVQGMAQRDVEAAEADWHQAEAESLRAKARLNNLSGKSNDGQFNLKAPLSGIVTERQVNAGSEVRPDAATPLFIITDPQHLWVLIDLPERQLSKVKVGQPVFIEVDAYPEEIFYGRITVVGETLDPLTRRLQVRCYVNNPQHKLKPEMYARVTPDVDNEARMPRIPNSALFTQGVSSYVFVELSPGVLQRRKVELALQDTEYAYVKQGLSAHDRVVTSGALLLNSELAGEN